MELTAEDRVKITSPGSIFGDRLEEKRALNASALEVGGTLAVTEIGL